MNAIGHDQASPRRGQRSAVRAPPWPLAVVIALVAAPALAATLPGLPLHHGVYVNGGVHCGEAGSSDRTWFGGGYIFQAPHAQCRLVSARQTGKSDYVVVERCLANADPGMPFRLVNRIHIISHREYTLVNREGHFRSRWCRD